MAIHQVLFDPDAALHDLARITSKGERRAIANVIAKLEELGPRLVGPHTKSLSGEPGLFELRPRQGDSPSRPIYVRTPRAYIVLAVAKDHQADMARAIVAANARLESHA